MQEKSDFELVELAHAGDAKAFEALLTRHYRMMYKVAFKWCLNRDNAQDITQEVCLKLGKAIHSYRFDSAFTTWLYRVVMNTAKDWQRQQNVRGGREVTDELVLEQLVSRDASQSQQVEAKQALKAVYALPEKLKETVLLVAWEGLSHAEAAKALGCAETTVSWRIFEARRKLKGVWEG